MEANGDDDDDEDDIEIIEPEREPEQLPEPVGISDGTDGDFQEPMEISFCDKEQTFVIQYRNRNAFITEHDTSSVGISLFTTAAARRKLFDAMAKVVDCGYCKLLYTDTDSLIYVCPDDKPNPLKTGEGLGELTDEYPNDTIVGYYSPGPKQYLLLFKE